MDLSVPPVARYVYLVTSCDAHLGHVDLVHHHDPPGVVYPPVPVVHPVDGGVVLVVAPDGHEDEPSFVNLPLR